jgi:hypothetical protein
MPNVLIKAEVSVSSRAISEWYRSFGLLVVRGPASARLGASSRQYLHRMASGLVGVRPEDYT